MKKFLLSLAFLCIFNFVRADSNIPNKYAKSFEKAYLEHSEIPKGILEAVSFCNTRFIHIQHESAESASCIGIPNVYGVMGLTLDGKNYFSNNLVTVSQLSRFSTEEIINDPEKNILAYADAFVAVKKFLPVKGNSIESNMAIIGYLSELPKETEGQIFAFTTQLYGYMDFLNNPTYQKQYNFPNYNLDLSTFFGAENFSVLSSTAVTVTDKNISDKKGEQFKSNSKAMASADYGAALWNPAASCNYSVGRGGALVSAVTIHDVEGSYAGCISWFQNCAASVSAHYVARSSDGQITQMVLESNKAWHVGSENPYTIGIEHEGYVSTPAYYTNAMYAGSAALVRDICASGYGIDPLRTYYGPGCTGSTSVCGEGACIRIKGHQMFPMQTHNDPGVYWNWYYYYELINNATPTTSLTAASGNFYDSGGPAGNYSDDERSLTLIEPVGATSITLTVNSFDLEANWDYMYIYDGNSLSSPLIGTYTSTTIPATITSTGGSMLIQFRSDCSTIAAGWNISWTSSGGAAAVAPTSLNVASSSCPNIDVNLNWTNSGTGWYLDISTDPTFTTFYNKDVSGLTSINCPGGFCDYPACTGYLQFQPSTTYYWRIWNGATQTYGSSFTTPMCNSTTTTCSGIFNDTGGSGAPYTGNEDYTYTIAPTSASFVTINFTSFDLENGFDLMHIHDGNSTAAPLIGSYTGTSSPGLISSTGSTITIHFISDPFVNNAGFTSTWTCTSVSTGVDEQNSSAELSVYPNPLTNNAIVSYYLSETSKINISMFDVLGKEIVLYSNENEKSGKYEFSINSINLNLSNGIYFLKMQTNKEMKAIKVIIK